MKKTLLLNFTALALAFGTALTVSTTQAQETSDVGLFIEPGISYEMGKTTTDWPSPLRNSTGESNGLGVMGRIGMHVMDIFFIGVDGRYSMTQFKDSSVGYSADATQFNWGPLVGVQTPLYGIRVWGTYVAGGFLDPKASGSPSLDVKLEEGTGYRLGVGGRYLMVGINLEYQNLTYNKTTLEAVGSYSAGQSFSSVKPKNESWIVSVSFPFSI